MTDSFNETKRELYELMQRSRRERFTPPTPEGVTPSEARTMMTVSALQHTCEDVRPGRVAELTHTTPSALSQTFKTLEEKGLIKRDPLKSRSIALTYQLEDAALATNVVQPSFSNIVNVPLVGNVAAGSPILAEENITDTLSLPTEIVGDAPSFLLSVRGESMIEAGINDGDYVVVKEQPVANNGDIVVAIIDDGATVKRFFKESDHIRLQPENSTMDPIITTDCAIAGKVVAVFRRL